MNLENVLETIVKHIIEKLNYGHKKYLSISIML